MNALLKQIITEVSTKYGAPMGRNNVYTACYTGKDAGGKEFTTISGGRLYDARVPMCTCCGAYDKGGAYWGIGNELRVKYNKDLTYVEFYRVESIPAPRNYLEL